MTDKLQTLQKVKEALENIVERENERIEPLVAAGKFPVEASVRMIAEEALAKLNEFIESLQPKPKSKQETDGELLNRLGMDGKLWAEEMHTRFPVIPQDDLLGWCCNMIMAGYDKRDNEFMEKENVAPAALEKLLYYGGFDGAHHKMWAIDQTVRILAGNNYDKLIAKYCDGGEYEWDIGIAP